MDSNWTEVQRRPLVLRAIEASRSWGSERWLNAARPAAAARVVNAPGTPSLSEVIAAQPAVLGEWSRLLFGDELPICTKLVRADFPPLAHLGFRRAVARTELMGWLGREQALLRQLLGSLELDDEERFAGFASLYADWATLQARVRWQAPDEAALAERLRPFTPPARRTRLVEWLGQLRHNRSQLVDALNEIDLEREEGNIILARAGLVHALFGQSLKTHAHDHAGPALHALLRRFGWLTGSGGTDGDLRGLIDAARLPAARALNHDAPKNEAWLPLVVGSHLALVTPQQSSPASYSLADFYTPFVWDGQRARFRKGDPTYGLRTADIAAQLGGVELAGTAVGELRRTPLHVPEAAQTHAELYRLVDEPAWPFFSAYRLELDGTRLAPASWRGDHGPGLFQQLVVARGEVELIDRNGGVVMLSPNTSAFIPATMEGGYRMTSVGAATILIFSVPGPRGGIVHGKTRISRS
jgi:hypothetical protein